jgi:L-threonylcarbamoyladenylate synthase
VTDAIARAAETLRVGGVVAYATDTLYGLAVDPRSNAAVTKLFTVKERELGRAIPLIAADERQAQLAGEFTPVAWKLVRTFWPGPLSIVVRGTDRVDPHVKASDGSIAVRVPDADVARALAEAFGFCITATSANLSGQPATASAAIVRATLADRLDYILDAGDAPGGEPSTIVDARGDTPRLVRAGVVPWDRVLKSLE